MGIVTMEEIVNPLLLLFLLLPLTSSDPCNLPNYNKDACYALIGKIGGGIAGVIAVITCCLWCYVMHNRDNNDEEKAAPTSGLAPASGHQPQGCNSLYSLRAAKQEVETVERTALIENTDSSQPSVQARVDRERTPVASKPNQQAMERLLRTSASRGEVEAVTALLDSGVGVDAGDQEGHTALYLACKEDRVDTVRLLLARGASPHVLPSPLEVAITKGNYTVAEALEAANNPA